MSEMSLQEQVRAIDEVISYFDQVKSDINYLNDEVENILAFLRQNGLRTEIADMVKSRYMGHINHELGVMLKRMETQDKTYLNEVKGRLVSAGGQQ